MARLVVLTDQLPSLPYQPGSPRLFSLCAEWSKNYRVTLLCLSKPQEVSSEFRDIFEEVLFLPLPPTTSMLGKLRHRIYNAPHFLQQYRCPAYVRGVRARIDEIKQKYQASHLHVNQICHAQYIPDSLESFQVTVDVRDAPSLLYEREATLAKNFIKRIDLRLEVRALGRYTQTLSGTGYQMVMVADADAEYLRQTLGVKSAVVPNGVDIEYFAEAANPSRNRPVAVFTGVMNYGPNIDTAEYFATEIFPIAQALCPELEFWIVGANPTEKVKSLAAISGVKVTGYVPDVRAYLHDAAVFVCPMRSGAGIKNKILAAMAAELPVVATALGVAGVAAKDGQHFFLREDPEEFAQVVVGIAQQKLATKEMLAQAKQLVIQNYDWSAVAKTYTEYFHSTLQPTAREEQQA